MTAMEAAAQSEVCAAFRLDERGRWWLYVLPKHLLFRSVEDTDQDIYEPAAVSEVARFTDWQPGYPPERKKVQYRTA